MAKNVHEDHTDRAIHVQDQVGLLEQKSIWDSRTSRKRSSFSNRKFLGDFSRVFQNAVFFFSEYSKRRTFAVVILSTSRAYSRRGVCCRNSVRSNANFFRISTRLSGLLIWKNISSGLGSTFVRRKKSMGGRSQRENFVWEGRSQTETFALLID